VTDLGAVVTTIVAILTASALAGRLLVLPVIRLVHKAHDVQAAVEHELQELEAVRALMASVTARQQQTRNELRGDIALVRNDVTALLGLTADNGRQLTELVAMAGDQDRRIVQLERHRTRREGGPT
jgi:hypothetical protein